MRHDFDLDDLLANTGTCHFALPRFADADKATFVFHKNIDHITWGFLSVLSKSPVTLAQTQAILNGQAVENLSIEALLQVKQYGEAAKELIRQLQTRTFDINISNVLRLHALVTGRDHCFDPIDDIDDEGLVLLKERFTDTKDRAIALFAYMARKRLFEKGNLRTASLMMNGCLMQAGFWPITIPQHHSPEFRALLQAYVDTGDATPVRIFFSRIVPELYPDPGITIE
ncbi:MAG: hypothetical protein Q4E62_06820 [Sutterellaceae bacterium]|nr:hypothetical protein [Sutterellaceae bacterium]